MGRLQALGAIKFVAGVRRLRENSDCSTVNRASGAAWRCAAPVVTRYAEEAMQILFNDQAMQCATGQLFTNYWSNDQQTSGRGSGD